MIDQMAVTGLIATDLRHGTTGDGRDVASFRLVSTKRRVDKATNTWVDADTNWFSVVCFGTLARNVLDSVSKGDRVLVTGKLKVRDWDNGEKSGTAVEIEASSLGHDLMFGTSDFERRSAVIPRREDEEDEDLDLDRELQPA